MKIFNTTFQNQQPYRIYNNNLNRRCSVSFDGRFYPNSTLDEFLKPAYTSRYISKSQKVRMRHNLGRKLQETLNSKTPEEKKIFEKELINRAIELFPELRTLRMEEYKKYYNQNEFRPPSGKIGILKQNASEYANNKLLQYLIDSKNN